MKRNRKIHFRKVLIKNPDQTEFYISGSELFNKIKSICDKENIKFKECKISIYSQLSYFVVKCTKRQYNNLLNYLNNLDCIEVER